MAQGGIGVSVKRKEDARFLTGRGNYVDDIVRQRQSFLQVVRSPHAHARIRAVRADAARAAPGVLLVLTGADLAAEKIGNIPTGWQIFNKDGTPMVEPAHPALALDRVRHVGDQVAIVMAETKDQAREAAQLVEVDYEELPAVAGIAAAARPGAPLGLGAGQGKPLLRLAPRRPGGGRRGLRQRRQGGEDRPPATTGSSPTPSSRARPSASSTRPPRRRRSSPPARTRTSRGSCSPPSATASPSTSCGWSRPTWAAASAPRSSTTRRSSWWSGRPASSDAR